MSLDRPFPSPSEDLPGGFNGGPLPESGIAGNRSEQKIGDQLARIDTALAACVGLLDGETYDQINELIDNLGRVSGEELSDHLRQEESEINEIIDILKELAGPKGNSKITTLSNAIAELLNQ